MPSRAPLAGVGDSTTVLRVPPEHWALSRPCAFKRSSLALKQVEFLPEANIDRFNFVTRRSNPGAVTPNQKVPHPTSSAQWPARVGDASGVRVKATHMMQCSALLQQGATPFVLLNSALQIKPCAVAVEGSTVSTGTRQ